MNSTVLAIDPQMKTLFKMTNDVVMKIKQQAKQGLNTCEDRHEPKYQITYKSAKRGSYVPVWLVCESCMENRSCFGSEDEIVSVEILA